METSASNTVKVALANNPTGAKLGGTLSVTASKGVATFSGLTINKVGTGYTLQVSSSGLTSGDLTADLRREQRQRDRRRGRLPRRPGPRTRSVPGAAGARQSRISWIAWDSRNALTDLAKLVAG